MAKKVLIPIPSYGFDPTEVAIPWQQMSKNKVEVIFATPNGKKAAADRLMLTGEKLGIWKSLLQARKDAVSAYADLDKTESFCNPITYEAAAAQDFDALFLPGGHDKGVKEYLESSLLQRLVVDFFKAQKPVGAICHGVVLIARSVDPETGKSVIYNYKTTSLLKSQEMLAYWLTKFRLKTYYLTYPGLTVEDEVKAALSSKHNYCTGPMPFLRDSDRHLHSGFVVKDRNYLSARWPGDAYRFSKAFIEML